jgi:hypothetical protein
MKFQLKALAAAAILAASIPAQAAIDLAASGNSSFVLTVLDKVANVQASFDLGKNYLDFNQIASAGAVSTVTALGTNFSWDLAGNADYSAAWSSFLGVATLPNIQYAITAADNLGNPGAGQRGYITTLAATGGNLTTSAMTTALGNFDTYAANESQNHVAANGSLFTASASTGSILYNSNRVGGTTTGPTTLGVIGSSLGVIQVTGGASAFANSTPTVFGNGAKFTLASNGALTYSTNPIAPPVPEADTWAMMLLGLGFMGFVARRKQA